MEVSNDRIINDRYAISFPIAGCMRWGQWGAGFSPAQYDQMIEECLDLGVTTFDHADIYGNYTTEAEFGEVLRVKPHLRDKMQLITKCGICMVSPARPLHTIKHYDYSAKHIIESVEQSLKNLQTDYLDVLLLHRPSPIMNPNEVMEAVEKLQSDGKIVEFGVSNFLIQHVAAIGNYLEVSYNQLEMSVHHLQSFNDGSVENAELNGITLMAWSPLGGDKAGKIENAQLTEVLKKLAAEFECTEAEIKLAWLYNHPAFISPVIGTTNAAHVRQAVEAISIELSTQQWFEIWQAASGKEVD